MCVYEGEEGGEWESEGHAIGGFGGEVKRKGAAGEAAAATVPSVPAQGARRGGKEEKRGFDCGLCVGE